MLSKTFGLAWLMAVVLVAMALVGCAVLRPQPVVERGFAEVNGTRLYYEVAGSGEALVLLHGLGGDTRGWDHNFDEFTRHYRTVRYDMRGYGQSAAPEQPYTHEDDLKALLDYLGISRAHILGQSFGGEQALNFVLAYPDRVLSFVSVAGGIGGAEGLPAAPAEDGEAYAAMGAALQSGDLDGAAKAILDMKMFQVVRKDSKLSTELVRIFTDYFTRHGADTNTLLPAQVPAAKRLGEVTVPSMYIVGDHDIEQNQALADLFVAGIPNTRKVVMSGCDHLSFLTKPKQFDQIVLRFLAENASKAK